MERSNSVVITGVSTGIGYEMCKALLARGYTVYGSVRKQEDADKIKQELGERYKPLVFDVTDHKAIEQAVELVSKEVGSKGIHALINNSGIAVGGPLLHLPIEEVRYQFEVNVLGLVKCIQSFAPLLGARRDHGSTPGRILNISSVAGKIGMPFIAPYVGSKHAVEGISHSLRRELLLWGIDVVIVGPGAVKTPIWAKSTDMSAYHDTEFGTAIKKFNNGLVKRSIDTGYEADYIGQFVAGIVDAKKLKLRYALVPQKFSNWVLPRILPQRWIDAFIGKTVKLDH